MGLEARLRSAMGNESFKEPTRKIEEEIKWDTMLTTGRYPAGHEYEFRVCKGTGGRGVMFV